MENLAVIAPGSHLVKSTLRPFHLILPQLLREDPQYAEYYRLNLHLETILDNGVFEGKEVPFDRLVELGRELQTTWLVLPDDIVVELLDDSAPSAGDLLERSVRCLNGPLHFPLALGDDISQLLDLHALLFDG